MLLFNINVFGFKTNNLTKQTFLVKREVATKRFFFYEPVFFKISKVIVFLAIFGQNLVDVQKHYKNRYFSTFLKAKNCKKWPFLMVTNWATLMVTNWATLMVTNWAAFVPL